MLEDEDWKSMFDELQADLSAAAEKARQDFDRGQIWQWRIKQIFNGKAALRIMPRISDGVRKEYGQTFKQAHELAGTIIDKIVRKEFNAAELDAIGGWLPAHSADPALKALHYPVWRATRTAWEMQWAKEGEAQAKAQAEETRRRETAVFSRYLSQNPTVVAVLQAVMPDKHGNHIDVIGERLGRAVTLKEIRHVAREINSILRNSVPLGFVDYFQRVKPKFEDLPKEMLRDEHHDVYFKVAGYEEMRNLINKFGEPPASAGPTAAPA